VPNATTATSRAPIMVVFKILAIFRSPLLSQN
jgi:hypothetical protein